MEPRHHHIWASIYLGINVLEYAPAIQRPRGLDTVYPRHHLLFGLGLGVEERVGRPNNKAVRAINLRARGRRWGEQRRARVSTCTIAFGTACYDSREEAVRIPLRSGHVCNDIKRKRQPG